MEYAWEAALREMGEMIVKHPGFEPESLKCQPFMVPYATMAKWREALEKCVEELYRSQANRGESGNQSAS